MGPPSYMRSVVDRNVILRRIPVYGKSAERQTRLSSHCNLIDHDMIATSPVFSLSGIGVTWLINPAGGQNRLCLLQVKLERGGRFVSASP